jgi:hypothetical protein
MGDARLIFRINGIVEFRDKQPLGLDQYAGLLGIFGFDQSAGNRAL